ncbi:hypothetical protein SAMN05216259_10417 [Actinacidiphila guanduensis]|uniref:Uncharacterized protein n=1 Tax=Actinacidiphila guanduensis TaxID=310781 RepID=A0A1H0B1W3_9ACTN|nr:hypothetical protein SAMN05216259_10417 [Actinacidiphila guanduensis]
MPRSTSTNANRPVASSTTASGISGPASVGCAGSSCQSPAAAAPAAWNVTAASTRAGPCSRSPVLAAAFRPVARAPAAPAAPLKAGSSPEAAASARPAVTQNQYDCRARRTRPANGGRSTGRAGPGARGCVPSWCGTSRTRSCSGVASRNRAGVTRTSPRTSAPARTTRAARAACRPRPAAPRADPEENNTSFPRPFKAGRRGVAVPGSGRTRDATRNDARCRRKGYGTCRGARRGAGYRPRRDSGCSGGMGSCTARTGRTGRIDRLHHRGRLQAKGRTYFRLHPLQVPNDLPV